MLLSTPRASLACLVASCGFFASSLAWADARQCVLHNNDGAQLRDDRHLLAAREAYRACIAEPDCPAMVRSECDAALAEIKTAIPTLLVAVVDEQGHDLAEATLKVDGHPVVLDGSTIEVDPGAHELVASSGALSSRLQVMAIESDVNRRVALVPRAPQRKLVSNLRLTPASAPQLRASWPAYALGGLAALSAASWGYFGLSGNADLSDLNAKQCKPHCDPSEVKRVRNEFYTADISLGVSVLALASAGYWLWSSPKAAPEQPAAVSLGVIALPGAAGFSVRWVE